MKTNNNICPHCGKNTEINPNGNPECFGKMKNGTCNTAIKGHCPVPYTCKKESENK